MAEIEVNEDDRVYSKRHLWAQLDREKMIAYVGITDFLAEQLAEIVSIFIGTHSVQKAGAENFRAVLACKHLDSIMQTGG